jgi:small subunit ribosomal protein S1
MTGEPEGLQPRADQQVEDAAPVSEPETDSAHVEESSTPDSSPEVAEPVVAEASIPTTPAAFSSAPSLPKPKPADLSPVVEQTALEVATEAPVAPAHQPVVAPDESGLPGLPSADATDEVSEEELKAIDEAVYQHLIEEATASSSPVSEGERRDGTVVSVSEEAAVINIGGKTEAVIPRSSVQQDAEWAALEIGTSVSVVVVSMGAPGEPVQLEIAREENTEAWDALEAAMADKRTLQGKVIERIKGGLAIEVEGLSVFLPGSQTGLRGGQDLDSMVGQTLPVRVVKVSRRRGNAVVSHRELLEEEAAVLRKEAIERISIDAVVEGVVKNVTSYGAFLDLGGVDGLIHVTDLSYGRVKDPASVLTPGQQVSAKVIKIDEEKGRVSLSLKAMAPDPWETVIGRFETGAKVTGKVASVTDYGAFIELEEGVEGLIHITEMTWSKRLRHPSKILTVGEDIEAVVLKVQQAERRISLSLKQVGPNPWEKAQAQYQTGTVVEGRVRNVTSYGAFVELEEGVDGLVHVSDLSWDRSVKDPKHTLKKGQLVRAVVLEIDEETHRISLGVKQLQPDAWESYFDLHSIGDNVTGKVVRLAKFGAFVELEPGVEGLCHSSQVPGQGQSRQGAPVRGCRYQFEIIKVDELDRRIGLRCLSLEPIDQPVEAS